MCRLRRCHGHARFLGAQLTFIPWATSAHAPGAVPPSSRDMLLMEGEKRQFGCTVEPNYEVQVLTRLDWLTLGVFGKTRSTNGVSQLRSRTTSIRSPRFSSSPMVPLRVSLSAHTTRSPLCLPPSQNHWPVVLPSCSPMTRGPSKGTSLGILSQVFSKKLVSSTLTTPSCSRRSTSRTRVVLKGRICAKR